MAEIRISGELTTVPMAFSVNAFFAEEDIHNFHVDDLHVKLFLGIPLFIQEENKSCDWICAIGKCIIQGNRSRRKRC